MRGMTNPQVLGWMGAVRARGERGEERFFLFFPNYVRTCRVVHTTSSVLLIVVGMVCVGWYSRQTFRMAIGVLGGFSPIVMFLFFFEWPDGDFVGKKYPLPLLYEYIFFSFRPRIARAPQAHFLKRRMLLLQVANLEGFSIGIIVCSLQCHHRRAWDPHCRFLCQNTPVHRMSEAHTCRSMLRTWYQRGGTDKKLLSILSIEFCLSRSNPVSAQVPACSGRERSLRDPDDRVHEGRLPARGGVLGG